MSRVIHLSEAASLAIHSMVLIARSKKNLNVNSIANVTGASRNHLARVMLRLVKDGFVKSTRGPSGGFVLSKKPKDVSLLDIYQSVEGVIIEDGCPLNRSICPNNECLMGNLFNKLTIEFKEYFKKQTLKDYL
ncbi:MAG: Rrf2 family transcriptional regulator [Bacteroidales bacterium]|nr:Rrf2 family transcriptional regulator [Bacteroidales bacterium]